MLLPIKNATREREREAERKKSSDKPTSPQKGVPPPIASWQDAAPLHNFSRQKISKKSLGVDLKKFSEKFFVGMFRGKKNPLRFSTEGGMIV